MRPIDPSVLRELGDDPLWFQNIKHRSSASGTGHMSELRDDRLLRAIHVCITREVTEDDDPPGGKYECFCLIRELSRRPHLTHKLVELRLSGSIALPKGIL